MPTLAALSDSHWSSRVGGRLAECTRAHHWIAEDCAKRKVSWFVHGGDVFHSMSRPDERLALRDWIDKLHAPMLVVAGNHDAPRDLLGVEPYGRSRAVHVVESPEVVKISGISVACLPDLRRDALVRSIVSRGEKPTSAAVAAEARAIIAMLGEQLSHAPVGRRMFLGHAMIRGSLKGGDQPRTHGDDLVFTAADFACVPADAFVFGHVHRGQWLPGFVAQALYVGSPYATTYAELEPKRYILLHFEGGRVEIERVPIPSTPVILLMGTWTGADLSLAYGPEHDAGDAVPLAEELNGADVRLRYNVPATDETAVDGAARAAQAELLAAGAVAVKLEPLRQRVTKVRAPEYKRATTLVERLDAYWSSCGGIEDAKRERVIALLPELAADVQPTSGGLIRVESMTISGLGSLVGESILQLADWEGVVAITGENGVGKSTLTGLLPAIVAGESPTHGALADLAHNENAYLEGVIETGAGKWRILHEPARGLSTVYGMDGTPIISGGRNTFRAWARQWLPDPRALGMYFTLRSRSVGLASLYDTGMQEALLRALGSQHLDAWAAAARKRASSLESRIKELDGALVNAPFDASTEAEEHETADRIATVAREAVDMARSRRAAWVAWDERRKAHHAATTRVAGLQTSVERARQDIRDASVVRKAADDLATAQNALMQAKEDAQRAEHVVATLVTDIRRIESELRRIDGELATTKRRIAEARNDLAHKDAIGAAMERLPGRRAAVETARTEADLAATSLEELLAMQQVGLRGRVTELRGQVRTIHDMTRDEDDADSTLFAVQVQCTHAERRDNAAANDDETAITMARNAKRDADEKLRTAMAAEAEDVRIAARIDVVSRAERMLTENTGEHERLNTASNALRTELDITRQEHKNAVAKREMAAQARARQQTEVERLERDASRLAGIARAEAMFDALQSDLLRALAEAEALEQVIGTEPPRITEQEVASAERQLERAVSSLGMATAKLDRARADVKRASEQRAIRASLAEKCDDYTTLETVLGRHGVQALEVEHEGELIAIETTERLQDVLGSRWSVQFDATRPDATTGKRMIEQARWTVIDATTDKGREIRACSDGEQSLMGTAMFFATASSMARRWGHLHGATMGFDETAVSLRGDRIDAWVEMVRRGMDDLKIGTLLLVPPDAPAVADMADFRLVVANGVVTMAGE